MNIIRKNIVIALAVLGMGSAAVAVQAQSAPPEGRHANAVTQEQRAAKMGELRARRQARLHDALQLTGGQEAAWAAYQAAIKPNPAAIPGGADREAWKTMSAPQRLEKMIAMSEQHTAMMKASVGPLNTFYSVLNPAQKNVFDQQSMGGGHHGRHGSHGGPGGAQGRGGPGR
jgi:protein CpxP